MRDESKQFLKNLLNAPSPSGFEEPAAEVWKNYVNSFMSSACQTHSYGHVSVGFGMPRHQVGLFGHLDEIGLIVNYINDEGFIYVDKIGGVDRANLIGRRVTIHTENGPVEGVIARKAAHLLEDGEEDEVPELSKLPIDIGAASGDEAKDLVTVGDPITLVAEPCVLLNDRIVSRALDDKVGAWVVAEVLRELSLLTERPSVVGVATVQEELGFHGASMFASGNSCPRMAIAIDVMHATDTPGLDKEKLGDIKLGGGPIISLGGPINKQISRELRNVADSHGIAYQLDIRQNYTGTDADGIFLKNGGIPTAVVSIPNRYMHSPVEMVQLSDLEDTVRLIKEWCLTKNIGEI